MLCDSNILIYAADPAETRCLAYVERQDAAISSITRIGVLGFPGFRKLPLLEQQQLTVLVGSLIEHRVNDPIVEAAINLRQARKMSLGDAIVAATALVLSNPWSPATHRTSTTSLGCD